MLVAGQRLGHVVVVEQDVNGPVRPDLDPLRPDLLGLTQGARDVGLFYSRRDGHGALVHS
jgi:hypothetical protein